MSAEQEKNEGWETLGGHTSVEGEADDAGVERLTPHLPPEPADTDPRPPTRLLSAQLRARA
eukprot:3752991-Rhodomonas_salina.1